MLEVQTGKYPSCGSYCIAKVSIGTLCHLEYLLPIQIIEIELGLSLYIDWILGAVLNPCRQTSIPKDIIK